MKLFMIDQTEEMLSDTSLGDDDKSYACLASEVGVITTKNHHSVCVNVTK